jgi:hypothetical protein
MHKQSECVDCQLLKKGKGSRSMGFSEEEIDLKICRKAIQQEEDRANERREWNYFHG